MKNSKVLILKDNYNSFAQYYLDKLNECGIDAEFYYTSSSMLRKAFTHYALPFESLWYGAWKNNLDKYDCIIAFDSLHSINLLIIITDKKECCGCTACEQICPVHCIGMNEDNVGFKYAKADAEKCINCETCDKVCPIKNHKKQVTFEKQAYLVQNKDAQILEESTSGGAFTAITEYVIDKGGIVYGVEMTDDYIVRHIAVDKKKISQSSAIQSMFSLILETASVK